MDKFSNPYKKLAMVMAFVLGGAIKVAFAEPADAIALFKPTLNQVTYELSAEDWAKTNTATVSVGVDAVFDENKLEQVRTDILKKLNQLTPNAQWHMTTFSRNPDQSGLERLQVQAQARVNNTTLGNLRQQAKALSKPGETYTILNIDYSPSLTEIEATRLGLHKQIYNQAKAELAQLNQMYPNQKYYLHKVDFLAEPLVPAPQSMMRMSVMADGAVAKAVPMPMSDKIMVTARVTLASTVAPAG